MTYDGYLGAIGAFLQEFTLKPDGPKPIAEE